MSELITLKNQFEEIGQATGNSKQPLIKRFGDESELFKETLNFVFNPYIITGLAKKKMEKNLPLMNISDNKSLKEMFNYVKSNNSGSDKVIRIMKSWIAQQPEETHEFLKGVFTKDIQIGISLKTINKVLGKNFIPEYSVQLAKKYEDEKHKIKGRFGVSLKLDGIRCTVFNGEDGPKFFSRKGLPIEGLHQLENEFKKFPTGMVYDGELVHIENGMTSDDLFRLTQKIVRADGPKENIRFIMFDMLPVDEFFAGKSKIGWEERYYDFQTAIDIYEPELIECVPVYYIGDDKDVIAHYLKRVTDQGYEGLMVNTANGKYQTKRTDDLLKVKKMDSADLKIIGFEEHRKVKGLLGSLIVDYKGYKVNVGSGFTDGDRAELWSRRLNLVGKIAEVQYFEESKNQNGGLSLRFPVFLQLRDDKTEPSYY
jgi:DNA ligase-1